MEHLEHTCKSLGIPYYWTACTANLPDGVVYIQGMNTVEGDELPGKLSMHRSIGLGHVIETHPDITKMPQADTQRQKTKSTNVKTVYDKFEEFSTQCRSSLQEIVDGCTIGRVPFFFSALTRIYTDGKMEYVCNGLATDGSAISLPDDRVNRHMLVCMGFSTKPPKKVIQTSFGDGIIVLDGDIMDDETEIDDDALTDFPSAVEATRLT